MKKLIKDVYVDIYCPERYVESLDEELPKDQGFEIIVVKPHESRLLPTHWEKSVRPGWEFKIELSEKWGVLAELSESKAKAKQNKLGDAEIEEISYMVDYLKLDSVGDWVFECSEKLENKPLDPDDFQIKGPKAILEVHREAFRRSSDSKEGIIEFVGYPSIFVKSVPLLNALKAIIEFQSEFDLLSADFRETRRSTDLNLGRFVYPFADLWYHRERLIDYKEEMKGNHDAEYSKITAEHIDMLLGYLDEQSGTEFKETDILRAENPTKCTFNSLWMILKPGSDVYVEEQGQLNAYVIDTITGGVVWGSSESLTKPYSVNVWNLNFDGQFLSRSAKVIEIPPFSGERDITSLSIFPTQLHKDEEGETPLRDVLVERGKRFIEVVKEPTFQEYSGNGRLQGLKTVSV